MTEKYIKHAQTGKRIQVIDPNTIAWERLANIEARAFTTIEACKDCGGPVVSGYCCNRCGSVEP